MAKFSVGDKVSVGDEVGVVIEVPDLGDEYLAKHSQYYSVRLDPWPKNASGPGYKNLDTGEVRDHAADSLGCVPEEDISFL